MTRIIPADKGTHFVAGAGITAVVLLVALGLRAVVR